MRTRADEISLLGRSTPIAGKTGTAEVDGRPAHSWFVGFAPYGGTRPIAFAVIIEHAGYEGTKIEGILVTELLRVYRERTGAT